MAYTKNVSYGYMPSSRVPARAKQFLVLVAVIVFGIIVSGAMNALPSSKSVNVAAKVNVFSPSIKN